MFFLKDETHSPFKNSFEYFQDSAAIISNWLTFSQYTHSEIEEFDFTEDFS